MCRLIYAFLCAGWLLTTAIIASPHEGRSSLYGAQRERSLSPLNHAAQKENRAITANPVVGSTFSTGIPLAALQNSQNLLLMGLSGVAHPATSGATATVTPQLAKNDSSNTASYSNPPKIAPVATIQVGGASKSSPTTTPPSSSPKIAPVATLRVAETPKSSASSPPLSTPNAGITNSSTASNASVVLLGAPRIQSTAITGASSVVLSSAASTQQYALTIGSGGTVGEHAMSSTAGPIIGATTTTQPAYGTPATTPISSPYAIVTAASTPSSSGTIYYNTEIPSTGSLYRTPAGGGAAANPASSTGVIYDAGNFTAAGRNSTRYNNGTNLVPYLGTAAGRGHGFGGLWAMVLLGVVGMGCVF